MVKARLRRFWRARPASLEKDDHEQLGHDRSGENRGEDDEGEAVLFLVVRQAIEEIRAGGTQVIRNQDRQHRALKDEGRDGIRLGCLPANGQRRAICLLRGDHHRRKLPRR